MVTIKTAATALTWMQKVEEEEGGERRQAWSSREATLLSPQSGRHSSLQAEESATHLLNLPWKFSPWAKTGGDWNPIWRWVRPSATTVPLPSDPCSTQSEAWSTDR